MDVREKLVELNKHLKNDILIFCMGCGIISVLIRCLAASYRRKLNILSTNKSMLSEGAAMPDESVDFCLPRGNYNENLLFMQNRKARIRI